MDKQTVINTIKLSGLIAVIRLQSNENITQIIDALIAGGVNMVEITMTTPGAIEIIRTLTRQLSPEKIIGVGTVTDAQTAESAIAAGAEFVVSPILNIELIKKVNQLQKVMISGAFTPTEIWRAWKSGADMVKVFPVSAFGSKYIKNIHGPLPHVDLVPTGGVNLENTSKFIESGACCIGVGSSLLNQKLIADKDWNGLTRLAADFINEVERGRN